MPGCATSTCWLGTAGTTGALPVLAMPLPKLLAIQIGNSLFNGLFGNTKADRKALLAEYKSALPDSGSYSVLERIQSDALYRMRSIRAAEIHSHTSSGKTYMSSSSTRPRDSTVRSVRSTDSTPPSCSTTSRHSDPAWEAKATWQKRKPWQTAVTDAWAAFARTGVPASSGLPEWPEFDAERRQTMMLNARSEVVGDPDSHIREIWERRRS